MFPLYRMSARCFLLQELGCNIGTSKIAPFSSSTRDPLLCTGQVNLSLFFTLLLAKAKGQNKIPSSFWWQAPSIILSRIWINASMSGNTRQNG